jgi:hypothetical protein
MPATAPWFSQAGTRNTPDVKLGTFAEAAEHGEIVFNATAGTASLKALHAAGAKDLRGSTPPIVCGPRLQPRQLARSNWYGSIPSLHSCQELGQPEQVEPAGFRAGSPSGGSCRFAGGARRPLRHGRLVGTGLAWHFSLESRRCPEIHVGAIANSHQTAEVQPEGAGQPIVDPATRSVSHSSSWTRQRRRAKDIDPLHRYGSRGCVLPLPHLRDRQQFRNGDRDGYRITTQPAHDKPAPLSYLAGNFDPWRRSSSTLTSAPALDGRSDRAGHGLRVRMRPALAAGALWNPGGSDVEVEAAEAEAAGVVLLQGGVHAGGGSHHEGAQWS